MNAQSNVYKINMERFEIFKAQDTKDGDFDITFEIKGKKLYAHKFMLCSISTTFKSMLSERWSKPDEAIKIEEYFFDDFKEFLTFIYSGECNLTNDNIFTMVDMAEFYGVQIFKETCEEYLTKMELNYDNIYQMLELASKYFLANLKEIIYNFISKNLSNFLESGEFLVLEKITVKEIVESIKGSQEKLFEGVYKWAENQAIEKHKADATLKINKTVKKELTEFLPFFKFDKMDAEFLFKFVAKKSFFTRDEVSDLLWSVWNRVYIKIIDKNGKEMKGQLQCDKNEKVTAAIKSQKNIKCLRFDEHYFYWKTRQPKPLPLTKLIKNENVKWYLIYDGSGDIAVRHRIKLNENNFLLAEMFAEDGFQHDENCKIEVV